jgi:prepilin-type N-terminal cleavage/methylation domain-containing protein/prepilin-type processing-associated H-X9-DG protein
MKSLSVSPSKSGFTLIELLVVIAIIAILAAILFPVFAKVREKARQTSCASNLKQLGLAFQQYINDYDEQTPMGTQPSCGGELGVGWGSQLYPYVKSTGVYACPDDSTKPGGTYFPVSYAYNTLIPNTYNTTKGHYSAFTSPAKTVLFCEVTRNAAQISTANEGGALQGHYSASSTGVAVFGADSIGCVDGTNTKLETGALGGFNIAGYTDINNPNGWHTDGSNFALSDGHVKWMKAIAVCPGGNNAANSTDGPMGGNPPNAGAAGTDDSAYAATFSTI